eukprot:3570944-Alexandrium_andersonii.AAC.1
MHNTANACRVRPQNVVYVRRCAFGAGRAPLQRRDSAARCAAPATSTMAGHPAPSDPRRSAETCLLYTSDAADDM